MVESGTSVGIKLVAGRFDAQGFGKNSRSCGKIVSKLDAMRARQLRSVQFGNHEHVLHLRRPFGRNRSVRVKTELLKLQVCFRFCY